jgi:hypothetical protein
MSKCVAFFSFGPYEDLFVRVGKFLRQKYDLEILHVREFGNTKGEKVFQFEKWIKENWNDIDISYHSLCDLAKKYPDSNLIKILYSERHYNFYPRYFKVKPVSYEEQLKYLVGCFLSFEEWFSRNEVNLFVSELVSGLPHGVIYAICNKRGIRHISLRSSKALPGIAMCDHDFDLPSGMLATYSEFVKKGIPDKYRSLAESHINQLRSKVLPPAYMAAHKKKYKLLSFQRLVTAISLARRSRHQDNISRSRHLIRTRLLWNIHRIFNIIHTRCNYSKWFCRKLSKNEKYFLYPLHYEPEASVLVQSFPFSNQMCVIEMIAKALPIGVTLVVKEHPGQQGSRKSAFYRELQYLPNVKLVLPEMDVTSLIKNSIGVVTLCSRIGWEALVIGKPVIALGSSFWAFFEWVRKPGSWIELKSMIEDCVNRIDYDNQSNYDERLLAYVAAYISLTHEGNSYVLWTKDFLSESNVENIAKALLESCPDLRKY